MFTFSWRSFFTTQLLAILAVVLTLVMFFVFPPLEGGRRELSARFGAYLSLGIPLFYIPYFIYQIFRPGEIKIDLDNKKAVYGGKVISLNKVKKINIGKSHLSDGKTIIFQDKDGYGILVVSSWYKTRSIESELIKLESYSASNHIEFSITEPLTNSV